MVSSLITDNYLKDLSGKLWQLIKNAGKSKTWRLIKVLVSLTLLVYLFARIDVIQLLSSIKEINTGFLLVPVGAWIAALVISAARWKLFLQGESISIRELTHLYWLGTYVNNFLPSTIGGDVFKYKNIVTRHQISRTTVFKSLVLERMSGAVTTAVFFLVVLPYSDIFTFSLAFLTPLVISLSGIVASILLIEGVVNLPKMSLNVDRVVFLKSMFYSATLFALTAIATQSMFMAFGADISVGGVILGTLAVTLVSYLPISMNAIGLKESYAVLFFSTFTVDATTVVAVYATIRILTTLLSASAGVLFIRQAANQLKVEQ